jgi:NAD(P)-dependent dehydrogenase (short-subunit alcohol dehydrogenase family)
MSRRFEGRRAVVTGASRGIGAGIARRLAAEGARVAIVARTLGEGDEPDGSLRTTQASCKGTVAAVVADLTDDADRARVIPEAEDKLGGPIDILVNNAAAAIRRPLTEISPRHQSVMFEANVITPLTLAQAVIPAMREAGEGWIVNLSSAGAASFAGPPFHPNPVGSIMDLYGATKAALNRVTNGLAVELYGTGVRVNAVQPRSAVMSEGMRSLADQLGKDMFEEIEQTVEAVVELCRCPSEQTGHVIVSLELIAELNLAVRGLDGEPLPIAR